MEEGGGEVRGEENNDAIEKRGAFKGEGNI